jgi:3-phenylpropionate/cinnamic acid dioxygenase small subunit
MAQVDQVSDTTRLTDELAILNRLARYCHTIDAGEEPEWLDCFTDDGSFVVWIAPGQDPVIELHGQDALRPWIKEHSAPGPDSGVSHITVNTRVVEITGDDAQVESYYITTRFIGDTVSFGSTGRYYDRLRRCDDGQWRIRERLCKRNPKVES